MTVASLRAFVRADEGQAIAEFALALPVMALVLVGLVQVGFVVNTKQQLEGVARQGARTFALTADAGATRTALRVAGRQLNEFERRASVRLNIDAAGKSLPPGIQRRLADGLDLPPGIARKLRGDWVEVVVTYDFANPVQATILGTRILPPSILLTTRAVARIEVDAK